VNMASKTAAQKQNTKKKRNGGNKIVGSNTNSSSNGNLKPKASTRWLVVAVGAAPVTQFYLVLAVGIASSVSRSSKTGSLS